MMWRYWVGAAVALLLVAGGIFYWRSTASAKHSLPEAPSAAATPVDNEASDDVPPLPPAASEKTREEKRFSRADHDKNGTVSRDEFLVVRQRNFTKLDVNNDGKLSFDEYAVKGEERFAKADADRSGGLNPKEFATTKIARKARATCSCDAQDKGKGDDDE